MPLTIYDISKRAGVSIATVSRVLNGSDLVSAKTRQRVLAVMEECGYTPNIFARGLGLSTMKTVGLLCAAFCARRGMTACSCVPRMTWRCARSTWS